MSPLTNLETMKEVNSPAARMYNWNILSSILKNFNIIISPSDKALLMTGNIEKLHILLK